MTYKLVRTPVPGWAGKVGEVTFADGKAKVDEAATEMAYFRSAGYGIDDYDEAVDAAANSDDLSTAETLDELGEQGGTHDDDPLIVADLDGEQTVFPRRSASTETWRKFAVDQGGMHENDANAMTRDELVAHFIQDDGQEVGK